MAERVIAFTKVKLPYGWLGNMSPHPIVACGKSWRTAEALFQALRFDDGDVQEAIRSQASPMAAKFVTRRHRDKMVVEPRSAADLDNMTTVLKLKLSQHRELYRQLIETGDALLVEDCTKRASRGGLFWGAALRNGGWVGENRLGRLWMCIRAELMVDSH